MMQIILLLPLFPFLFDIITASPRNIVSLSTASPSRIKLTTKEISFNTTKLQKFTERLEKECDFNLLNEIYKNLKSLWAKAMKEEEHISSEMIDEREFLKKIIDLYNNCTERMVQIDFERQWEIYLKIFGKNYTAIEKEMRKEIFKKKMEYVRKHNELYRKGSVTYVVSLNHLSDWTKEELEKLNGFLPPNETLPDPKRKTRFVEGLIQREYYYNPFNVAPASFDWRTKHYVNPVMDQGSCGSCYAIAGLGALEAFHKKGTGELVKLSVQNILDCTWHLGNKGCAGGHHKQVFEYAYGVGVMANSRYPYTMNASHNCQWRRELAVATNRGYYIVEIGNELALRNAVADHGPVAVAIAGGGLHDYRSGIFDSNDCGNFSHGMLVVGYGTDPWYGDFWIARNCWGFWWGENGYVRIARNKNNVCNIASRALFPY